MDLSHMSPRHQIELMCVEMPSRSPVADAHRAGVDSLLKSIDDYSHASRAGVRP